MLEAASPPGVEKIATTGGHPIRVGGITRRLAAVAFADVAGWTRWVEADDVGALHAWSALRIDFIEPKIREHGGRLVDLAGDAVLVEFPSAIEAVGWALALQAPGSPARRSPLQLRVGISVGDVLVDGGRLVGDEVNIAARVHQLAAPGEAVVTEAVRQHVQQRLPVVFRDLGEQTLKNLSRPIRIWRVEPSGHAAVAAGSPWQPVLDPAGPAREPAAVLALSHCPPGLDVARHLPGGQLLPAGDAGGGLRLRFADVRQAVRASFKAVEALAGGELPRFGLQLCEGEADPSVAALGLAGLAEPGTVVASAGARYQLTPTLDADVEDLGELPLAGEPALQRAFKLVPPRLVQGSGAEPRGEREDSLCPTVAVIPFVERGSGHETLGEIVADELISALSQSSDLDVVSRLSTTEFKHRAASLSEVGRHLRANYVMSGSYRVAADRLLLHAELAEAASGRVVWARELRGSVQGVIEGRDDLVDRLIAECSSAVMARELERTQTHSLRSLETCTLLMGSIALMHRLSRSDFNRAHDMLSTVAQRVPRHAVPLAWLAKWHVLRVWQGWSANGAADTQRALDLGQRALDADSHCSLALAIDGFAHTNLRKRLDLGQARYDQALQVNPNDSLAWLLSGMLHAFKGEGRSAVKATHHALKLSPLDPHRYFYDSLAASAELSAGHHERAIALAQRSLRANRMHASTHRALAIAQWLGGHPDDARRTVAELMQIDPQLTVGRWLERSPSSEFPIGRTCAEALRGAGVPA